MDKKLTKHEDVFEYVKLVQNGNFDCLEILIEKFDNIIGSIVQKYKGVIAKHNIDREDFKQDLYVGFIECVSKFPLEHENFIAYTFNFLNNYTFNFLRQRTAMISQCDHTKGNYEFVSTYTDIGDGLEMIEAMEDENSKYIYDNILDKITHEKSKDNIRNILNKFISTYDIDFLYDIYGLNSNTYTITEICKKYNITIHEFVCYERLCILTLQTNKKLYDYYEQLMSNISYSYNYTYSRFKYTHTSSTEYIAIKNVYLQDKINDLVKQQKSMLVLHKEIIKETAENGVIRVLPKVDTKNVTKTNQKSNRI